ncbi:copper resistance CopC family protein [Pseudactinotalea suaedae]|uniref:copper resistance CopC family protein n=1 Tax=Pseudactinotalea suaedae TaxID=1524924 RepID=UPI0012E1F9E2|nr:copper resistance CopC family protein [Pseudactinotalea suaedae]
MVLSRRFSTASLTFLVVMLTTAVLCLVVAGTAQAHSALVSSTPSDGSSTSEIPTEIVLEFNEDIQNIGNEIVVVDSEGTSVTDGEMVVDGPIVTQPIGVGAPGAYTVTWRVVSLDGHPISGEFSYELQVPQTVEATETTEASQEPTTETTDAATTETSVAPSSVDAEEDDTASGLGAAAPIAIGLAVLALVVVVVLVVRRRRAR